MSYSNCVPFIWRAGLVHSVDEAQYYFSGDGKVKSVVCIQQGRRNQYENKSRN